MIATLGTGFEAIPHAARLSSSYAAGEITAIEYNAGLRVAGLEDSVEKANEGDLAAKLKQYHADGVRYGLGMAIAVVKGYLEAWNDSRLIAAVPPDQAAARRDQLERVLESLLECEMKLQ